MTAVIVARFADAEALKAAAADLARDEFRVVDAFTPFPVELEAWRGEDGVRGNRIGWAAALGGLSVAALIYAAEAFSAGVAYPFDSGGRPLQSWPVFLLAPFELGVLAAAVSGFVAFLWLTGLPRLHHAAFEIPGIDRASQDGFFLAVAAPETDERRAALARLIPQGDVWEGEL